MPWGEKEILDTIMRIYLIREDIWSTDILLFACSSAYLTGSQTESSHLTTYFLSFVEHEVGNGIRKWWRLNVEVNLMDISIFISQLK